jgi:N-succinyldiaminopimelate aminotransferase
MLTQTPAAAARPVINERLNRLSDYPFTRLAALLGDAGPQVNRPPLVMSVGEPQHAPPALLEQTLRENAHLWNKYPPLAGTPDFRRAAAGWVCRRFGIAEHLLDPDASILPVAGTREALFMAAQLCVPDRKNGQIPAVLSPNPFYAVYEGGAVMAGAEPVFLAAEAGSGFLPDLDALEAQPELLARTALFYLCSPSNPQGSAADLPYLKRIITLARRWNFVLAMDECYAEIYLDEAPAGAFTAAADLPYERGPWDNLLVFHSLSKRSNAAGMRSGFVIGDPWLIAGFNRLRNYANAGTSLPGLAAAAALWRDDAHVVENRALYREKFACAETVLAGRLGYRRPAGGFFLWLDVGDGEAAAKKLWIDGGLRVLPGAYLSQTDATGANPGARYIRVAVVHDVAVVREACETMVRLLG